MTLKLRELDSQIDRYIEIHNVETMTLPTLVKAYCSVLGLSAKDKEEVLVFMNLLKEYYNIDVNQQEKFDEIVSLIFETYSQQYNQTISEVKNTTSYTSKTSIDSMTGVQFEQITYKLLTAMGLEVSTTKTTADGGIELRINPLMVAPPQSHCIFYTVQCISLQKRLDCC